MSAVEKARKTVGFDALSEASLPDVGDSAPPSVCTATIVHPHPYANFFEDWPETSRDNHTLLPSEHLLGRLVAP